MVKIILHVELSHFTILLCKKQFKEQNQINPGLSHTKD